MSHWERNARYVEETFGVFVDWKERFYNCPYCGEPVYESDWDKENFQDYLCPICEDADGEDDFSFLYFKDEN